MYKKSQSTRKTVLKTVSFTRCDMLILFQSRYGTSHTKKFVFMVIYSFLYDIIASYLGNFYRGKIMRRMGVEYSNQRYLLKPWLSVTTYYHKKKKSFQFRFFLLYELNVDPDTVAFSGHRFKGIYSLNVGIELSNTNQD